MPHVDPEARKEYHRKWYIANKAKKDAQNREWQQNNRAARVASTRKCQIKNPDVKWGYNLKSKYGITLDEYRVMLESQGGKCAICRAEPKDCRDGKLVVDHMHCSGRVRALLCHRCNSGIAMLQDNPDVIYAAAQYVRKHQAH